MRLLAGLPLLRPATPPPPPSLWTVWSTSHHAALVRVRIETLEVTVRVPGGQTVHAGARVGVLASEPGHELPVSPV